MTQKNNNVNPFLAKLDLPPNAKAVVIHADDIGMSYSTVAGFPHLLDAGPLSAAAVMVPCPWFPAAARMIRDLRGHPRLDIGVHLTLTSEWDDYRWGPIHQRDPKAGLMDREGYFHRREVDVWEYAVPAAVEMELRAQIETALAAGIDVTHIDSHMGSLFHPRLLPIYVKLANEFHIPPFLVRPDVPHMQSGNMPAEDTQALVRLVAQVDAQGIPLFDGFYVMDLGRGEGGWQEARAVLSALPPGSMTYFILHPNIDAADLRAFAPDWRARVDDYRLLTDPAFRDLLDELGITVIGMRALRDAMRTAS